MRTDNRIRATLRLKPGHWQWLTAESAALTAKTGGAVRRGGNGVISAADVVGGLIQDEMNRREAKARKERAA